MPMSFLARLFGQRATVSYSDYFKDPVAVLTRDGEVAEVNAAFARLLELKKEDIIGKDCREVKHLDALWNSITACALHRSEQVERITDRNRTMDVYMKPVIEDRFLNNIVVEFRDVSAYVNLEREFLKRNKELVVTNALSATFISSHNIETVFSELLEKVLIISDFSIGWIVTREESFRLRSADGVSSEFRDRLNQGNLDALYERIAESEDLLSVFDHEDAARIDDLREEGIVFLAAIPLRVAKETTGFLILASRLETEFDFDVASLFSLLGNNLSLITEKIRLFQETQRLAITDDLTGLHNIRYFYHVLESEIARTERYKTPFSIVLFDIDNFKELNDTFGHQAGDEVLRSVAQVMEASSRAPDTVARYGGEEFIAVLPNAGREEAFSLAQRIKDAVELARFLGEHEVRVTVSGGVACFPKDGDDAKSLLYAADMAMYEAKAAGKGKICCHGKK
jgi:diguanylate cyclase (GGDEF)-like protein